MEAGPDLKQAFGAAVAVCNLGLAKSPALPDERLIAHDLIERERAAAT